MHLLFEIKPLRHLTDLNKEHREVTEVKQQRQVATGTYSCSEVFVKSTKGLQSGLSFGRKRLPVALERFRVALPSQLPTVP